MKVGIVGSRAFRDLERVVAFVDSLPIGTIVISGEARGVDSVAEHAAINRGLTVWTFPPDYKAYGRKRAPLERNSLIAETVDRLVAFWDGRSTGTMDTVRKARALGKPVEIIQ